MDAVHPDSWVYQSTANPAGVSVGLSVAGSGECAHELFVHVSRQLVS